jgi:catecholate siderophore receptor
MKTYTKKLEMQPIKLMACGILSLTINPVSLLAQGIEAAAENEVYELEEFVVTDQFLFSDQVNALKTPTPVIDVPQSLSITSAADISLRGFDSVSDIVDYTPGVNSGQGENHRDAVVFRGLTSTADFFVDGVRDDVQYYRPLYNIEQVEILRGANALLFGRGGAGGIVNRVTKKGEIGQNFDAYSFSMNSFGANEAQYDKNVTISDTSAFRLNAYASNYANHRDFSDGSGYGINPSFKFALSDQTTFDLSFEAIDYDRSIDRGIPTDANGAPVEAFRDVVFGDPELNKSEFESGSFRAMLQHSFSDTVKGILNFSFTDYSKLYQNFYVSDYLDATNSRNQVLDAFGQPVLDGLGNPSVDPDRVETDGYVDTTDRQNLVLSANLVAEYETGDIKHTLLFGAEFLDSSSENDRFNPDFNPAAPVLDPLTGAVVAANQEDNASFLVSERNLTGGLNAGGLLAGPFTDDHDNTSTDLAVLSLYVQDEINLSDKLTALLGARYDNFDIDVTNNLTGGQGSQKDTEITPRAGIIFKPEDNISLYVSYSETFLPQSGEQFASLGDAGLDPDYFSNLEAGVKWNVSDGFSVTAAVFKIEQDTIRENDDFDTNGFYDLANNEIEGFEVQILKRMSNQWTISAGYTSLDGDTSSFDQTGNGGAGEITIGETGQSPSYSWSIWNNYQVSEKLGLGLGARYQDDSTSKSGGAVVPSFTRVDAAAYYQLSENLRLQVNIENLLDEEYYPHAYSTHQVSVGAPLNASVSVSGTF